MATNKERMRAKAEARAAAELEATRRRKQFVEDHAGYGMAPEEIALLLDPPTDGATLKADYALEIEIGQARKTKLVLEMIDAGIKKGNATLLIYWTKAQLGWTEKGPSVKEPPEASESAAPTQMPTARQLTEKILPFQRPSSPRFSE